MEVNSVLMGLLGRALFDADYAFAAQEADWEAIFREARAQTVDLLAFDALTEQERAALPSETAAAWQAAAFRRLQYNEGLHHEQMQILNRLSDAGIPCVVLKGFSCGIHYPKPMLRCAGDIDLLVSEQGMHAAKGVLEAYGYEASDEPHPFHIHLHKGWISVELHYEPAGIPQGDAGALLRAFFQGKENMTERKESVPLFPVCEQAVTLLLHKLEHILTGGLGLRQVCDWAMFVRMQLKPDAWEATAPVLKSFGLLHFAKNITRICVNDLYLPVEAAPWCMEADSNVAEALLQDILCAGNFGRKENRYGQRLFTDVRSGSRLSSFFRVGIQACKSHWPVCERYPILIPFAPFVLLKRYRTKRKEGKRPEFQPRERYKDAKVRQRLYVSLKPFEKE